MGDMMGTRSSRQLRRATLLFGCFLVLYCMLFLSTSGEEPLAQSDLPTKVPEHVLQNLFLDEPQCETAFPGLTKEIKDTVAEGPFTIKQTNNLGPLQGRIKDGRLYIIHSQRKADLSQEMLNSRTAALQQLHRALITSPTPLPDTIFSLNFQDSPFGTAWTYSRPADPLNRPKEPDARSFLMPHFSFWAWKLPFIGSMTRATDAIAAIEAEFAGRWDQKINRAVWRGTTWFNSVHNPRLRQNLLAVSKGKPWADVEALEWVGSGANATNALPIEDFCRYKYVLHTEGIAYSGRFQFLQMCSSVVLTPPVQWLQHTTHLVRPLFSGSLDLTSTRSSKGRAKAAGSGSALGLASGSAGEGRHNWVPPERVRGSWPVQYSPAEANIVFVAPDWSDLEDTIAWLEDHPKIAEGIARRQRALFVDGGYFSPAAEVCYWRALVRGWAQVARTEGDGWDEGVPFETFSLTHGN